MIGSSYKCLTDGRTTGLLEQTVDVLEQAAQDRVKAYLNSSVGVDVCVWEVRPVLIPD